MNKRQENTTVNEGTADQEFTVGKSQSSPAVIENPVNVETLERCFKGKVDRETGNNGDTVKYRIRNAILSAIGSNITPKFELAVQSKNASSGWDATSVMPISVSERGESIGITAPSENVSERNNTPHVLNTYDETRNKIPNEVNELSVPSKHFNRQPHTHHLMTR